MKKVLAILALFFSVSFTLPPPPGVVVEHGVCCLTPHTVTRVLRAAAPYFNTNHGQMQSAWQHGEVTIDHSDPNVFVVGYSGGLTVVSLGED